MRGTQISILHIEHLKLNYDETADFLGGSHVKRYCDVDRDDELLLPPPAAGD